MDSLSAHIETHHGTGEELYKCELCEYAGPTRAQLAAHKRSHKAGLFPCRKCGFCAETRQQLMQHSLSNHTARNAYQCPHCDYSTAYKAYIPIHIRKHTGTRGSGPQCSHNAIGLMAMQESGRTRASIAATRLLNHQRWRLILEKFT